MKKILLVCIVLYPAACGAVAFDVAGVLNSSISQKTVGDFYSRWPGRPFVFMPPYGVSLKLLNQWDVQIKAPGTTGILVSVETRISATRVYAGSSNAAVNSYTMIGVVDHGQLEPITLIQPSPHLQVEILPLRKNEPPFILLREVCEYADCSVIRKMEVYGFNSETSQFFTALSLATYQDVFADGPGGSSRYNDRSDVSWTDWTPDGYREMRVTTQRTDNGSSPPEKLKNRTDIYSWTNRKLFLVERTDDGQIVLKRTDPESSPAILECRELLSKFREPEWPDFKVVGHHVVRCLDYLEPRDMYAANIVIQQAGYPPGEKPLPPSTVHALVVMATQDSRGSDVAASLLCYQSASPLSPDDTAPLWNYVRANAGSNPHILCALARTGDAKVLPYLTQPLKLALDGKTACQPNWSPLFEGLRYLAEKNVPFSPKDRYELHRLAEASCPHPGDGGPSISDDAKNLLNKHHW